MLRTPLIANSDGTPAGPKGPGGLFRQVLGGGQPVVRTTQFCLEKGAGVGGIGGQPTKVQWIAVRPGSSDGGGHARFVAGLAEARLQALNEGGFGLWKAVGVGKGRGLDAKIFFECVVRVVEFTLDLGPGKLHESRMVDRVRAELNTGLLKFPGLVPGQALPGVKGFAFVVNVSGG